MKQNSQKVKERSYLMVYEFGNGKITVQSGRMNFNDKETGELKHSLPFVDLGVLNEKKEVGEDLIGLDPEAKYYSKLFFTNIESLEVLERALAFCRKELELKSETKP